MNVVTAVVIFKCVRNEYANAAKILGNVLVRIRKMRCFGFDSENVSQKEIGAKKQSAPTEMLSIFVQTKSEPDST